MTEFCYSIMIMNSQEFGYPVHHKRKVPFNPQYYISPEINRLNIEIFRLEEELDRFILTIKDYSELVQDAFASNIHVSTQLEGNPLTKADVKRFTSQVVEGVTPTGTLTFPYQEILNHLYAYLDPHFGGSWDLDTIRAVHGALLQGDALSTPGGFREDRRDVVSSEGQVLFVTAPPEYVKEELQSLIRWLNNYGSGMYPTLAGAIFFHEFESIHPFGDGNGRCGRSLFHIYLQHHGLPNSKLCFIEQHIVSDSEYYYELLAKTDFYEKYEDLVHHFTKAVHQSYVEAVQRYKEKDLLSSDLDEGAKRALRKAKQYKHWFDLHYAKSWFEHASDHVVRTRLNELVECGALISKGKTRGKRYRYVDPIEVVFEAVKKESSSREPA